MNKQMKHIAYYTRKVAQEGTKARPTYIGTRNAFRNNRLLMYKRMLNEMITNIVEDNYQIEGVSNHDKN